MPVALWPIMRSFRPLVSWSSRLGRAVRHLLGVDEPGSVVAEFGREGELAGAKDAADLRVQVDDPGRPTVPGQQVAVVRRDRRILDRDRRLLGAEQPDDGLALAGREIDDEGVGVEVRRADQNPLLPGAAPELDAVGRECPAQPSPAPRSAALTRCWYRRSRSTSRCGPARGPASAWPRRRSVGDRPRNGGSRRRFRRRTGPTTASDRRSPQGFRHSIADLSGRARRDRLPNSGSGCDRGGQQGAPGYRTVYARHESLPRAQSTLCDLGSS